MEKVRGGMPVFASDGEPLGRVARTDEHGLTLRRQRDEVHVDDRHLKNVDERGVELWLASAELPVSKR